MHSQNTHHQFSVHSEKVKFYLASTTAVIRIIILLKAKHYEKDKLFR